MRDHPIIFFVDSLLQVGDLDIERPREVDIHLNFSLAARRESLTNPTVKAVRDAIHAEVGRRRTELLPPVK